MTPPPPEATVHFNDHPLACPEGLTLAALLEQQGVNPARVATALNARFVPREARAQTPLRAGDVVVTFEAIVGG